MYISKLLCFNINLGKYVNTNEYKMIVFLESHKWQECSTGSVQGKQASELAIEVNLPAFITALFHKDSIDRNMIVFTIYEKTATFLIVLGLPAFPTILFCLQRLRFIWCGALFLYKFRKKYEQQDTQSEAHGSKYMEFSLHWVQQVGR